MIQDHSGSWCIKGTDESMTRVDSLGPMLHHDLGSLILIQITPKERTLNAGDTQVYKCIIDTFNISGFFSISGHHCQNSLSYLRQRFLVDISFKTIE